MLPVAGLARLALEMVFINEPAPCCTCFEGGACQQSALVASYFDGDTGHVSESSKVQGLYI